MPHPSTSSRSVREHARHFAEVEARGANPRGSTTSKDSVADTERRLSCKQVYVGASAVRESAKIMRCGAEVAQPQERQSHLKLHFQHSLLSVTAAFLVVNEAVPGQNRQREPTFQYRAHGEVVEPVVRKSTLPSASLGRTSSFIGYERASELAWFGTKTGPGQHRGIRPILVCSLTVRASGS